MKSTLLRRAHNSKTSPDQDKAVLSVAWATDEISFTQAQRALEAKAGSGVYTVLARGLRDAFRLGILEKKA